MQIRFETWALTALVALSSVGCSSRGGTETGRPIATGDAGRADGGAGFDAARPPPACSATLTGVVRFPNGVQPVPKAIVYVPTGTDPAPRTGECGQCIEGTAVYAHVETGIDGTFSLPGVPEGTHRLVVEKGPFVRTIEVSVTECGATLPLDPERTRLPRDETEGRIARIAVATGAYDAMENVLAKIGLGELDGSGFLRRGSEPFDLYDGSGEGAPRGPIEGLLRSREQLSRYDIVLINCGSLAEEGFDAPSILEEPAIAANLRAYVEGGGRLYVTDEAYDYVERSYPAMIDFEGGGAGLTETAEAEDVAEIGDDLGSVSATLHDEDLRAWLGLLGLASGDTVTITGMISGWSVIADVDAMRAKTWVSGPVRWLSPDGFDTSSGTRPLTVTFDRGCGRVLYTSYHTDDALEGGGSAELSPQELILAYLILEIGSCIEDPILI